MRTWSPELARDTLTFVRACVEGDAAARRALHEAFAEDVYNFPAKIYGASPEDAADFYLYVFEGDRIFARLRTFEGRNEIQLRTFLAYYVLRGLFVDWQRGRRELVTVSLDHVLPEGPAADADESPAHGGVSSGGSPPGDATITRIWHGLTAEERLDLKLLSLLEHDLDAAELRLLAQVAGRSLDETRALVDEVQADLRRKDEQLGSLRDELDSVWGWLVLRRRELQENEESLRLLGTAETAAAEALRARRASLEAAIAKRARQHERVLEKTRSHKTTTSYKDIARLKGSTVGTVCSRIFRLRERLEAHWRTTEGSR